MPGQNLTPENVGKFQKLIIQNPIAFLASVFFIMFGFTYSQQYLKELYIKERDKNDNLQTQLLVKAGGAVAILI